MLNEGSPGGNCYTDSTEGRLLAFKSPITYTTGEDATDFKGRCKTDCHDHSFPYAGIELIDGTKTLECWCGETQPLG